MVCPWLEQDEDGEYYCTSVSPKVKLDFTKPSSNPNVNGDTCMKPEPKLLPTDPWRKCDWYRPKYV